MNVASQLGIEEIRTAAYVLLLIVGIVMVATTAIDSGNRNKMAMWALWTLGFAGLAVHTFQPVTGASSAGVLAFAGLAIVAAALVFVMEYLL